MNEAPDYNRRLREAVNSVEVPPFLEARIRSHLRTVRPGRRWLPSLATLAAAGTVAGGLAVSYQLGYLRYSVQSQEAYIASVSSKVSTMMRVGLGDHIHCAVYRKYPDLLPTAEEFVEKMKPEYAPLVPLVRSHVPADYQMSLAHECRYHGRRFVHISLKNSSHMMSVILTRKRAGETFQADDVLPSLVRSGIPMYQTGVQRFQMTAFETKDYLVYFISDLSKQQSTDLMVALAPPVKAYLATLGS